MTNLSTLFSLPGMLALRAMFCFYFLCKIIIIIIIIIINEKIKVA